jgi:hypothetical protein
MPNDLTLNQVVVGSIPTGLTNKIKELVGTQRDTENRFGGYLVATRRISLVLCGMGASQSGCLQA